MLVERSLDIPIAITKVSGVNLYVFTSFVEGAGQKCPSNHIPQPVIVCIAYLCAPCSRRHDTSSACSLHYCRLNENEKHYYCNIMRFVL